MKPWPCIRPSQVPPPQPTPIKMNLCPCTLRNLDDEPSCLYPHVFPTMRYGLLSQYVGTNWQANAYMDVQFVNCLHQFFLYLIKSCVPRIKTQANLSLSCKWQMLFETVCFYAELMRFDYLQCTQEWIDKSDAFTSAVVIFEAEESSLV